MFRWDTNNDNSSQFFEKGRDYHEVAFKNFMIAISRPFKFWRGASINVRVVNVSTERIDVTRESFSCACRENGRELRQLGLRDFPKGMSDPFLLKAQTLTPGESITGTLDFRGECKHYLVQWKQGNAIFEFPFDMTQNLMP